MTDAALCQCTGCLRYLTVNREYVDQTCVRCGGDLPLAEVRACCTDPLTLEVVALLTEEAGEVSQRVGKIIRWGMQADFAGTSQRHKLEVELGDVLAAIFIGDANDVISASAVMQRALEKLEKFREDARGPRQRLQIAKVPSTAAVHQAIDEWDTLTYDALMEDRTAE